MTVGYERQGDLGLIRISRPERRNALNHDALEELADAVAKVREDAVKVVVLTGDADHFCSGADLRELEDLAFTRTLRTVLDDLAGLAVPTVAAISGACMGLGMQLAVSCDLRLATADARFAIPVAKLGLMVDHWTIRRAASLVGPSMARWMVMTAKPVTAERMFSIGFVQDLVDTDESGPGASVETAAISVATDVATLAPLALSGSKVGMDLLDDRDADAGGIYQQAFEKAWASDDLVEGRSAFTEGRRPDFSGQ